MFNPPSQFSRLGIQVSCRFLSGYDDFVILGISGWLGYLSIKLYLLH